jgi:uncharacterized membrane protein
MAATKAARKASDGLGSTLAHSKAAERLASEARNYAAARGEGLVQSLSDKLGSATQRLEDHAENPGAVGAGMKKLAEGKSPLRAGISSVGQGLKDKVKSAFGKGRGSSGPKMTNIVEDIDIGAPISDVYDQWTQFQEFSSFMKGVSGVDQTDEVESNWRGKVWWSSRSWKATITEQIPDRKVAWTSEGAKGTTKGVVTFHPLADDLTKVLVVMEYTPGGVVEKTANLWRAFGRRVRLDLKHFRRFVSLQDEPTGSWRGVVEDGEVVRQPEDVENDEREADEDDEPDEASYDEEPEPADDEPTDEADAEDYADEEYDELDDEDYDESEDDEPQDVGPEDEEPEDEEPEDEESTRRRSRGNGGSKRRRAAASR